MDATAAEVIARVVVIGIGATAISDLWAVFLRRAVGMSTLDYALVGRWLGHMPSGRFAHQSIAAAAAVRGERALGWFAHYATGMAFAAILVAFTGVDWLRQPTPGPALIIGVMSVAAPFLLMQPGMGLGVAASRSPRPNLARLRSLLTHSVFGIGLFAAARAVAYLAA